MSSISALRSHRFLLRLGFASAGIFSWIFAFQYFYFVERYPTNALVRVLLLYALSQAVVCLATPLAARTLRHGAKRALVIACFLGAAAFMALGATFSGFWGSAGVAAGITLFSILLGLYRASYWVPYAVESEGKKHSSLGGELILALAPFLAGVFLSVGPLSFVLLLFFAALLVLSSVVPLRRAPETFERFSWGYRRTLAELTFPENRTLFWKSFLEGVCGAAFLFLWPIAIFPILGWSYAVLGATLTATFFIAMFLRGPVQRFLRRMQSESTFIRVALAVSPWILRAVVASPLGIIFVDSYYYTTTRRRIGLDPAAFEQTADAGSLLDEYTALKEIALALGRLALCCAAAALVPLISPAGAFLVAFFAAAGASVLVL